MGKNFWLEDIKDGDTMVVVGSDKEPGTISENDIKLVTTDKDRAWEKMVQLNENFNFVAVMTEEELMKGG